MEEHLKSQKGQRKTCLQESSVCWQMQNTMPQKGMVLAGASLSVCAAETESLYFTYLESENPSSTLQDKLLRVTNKFEALFDWHSSASYKYTETPSCNSA